MHKFNKRTSSARTASLKFPIASVKSLAVSLAVSADRTHLVQWVLDWITSVQLTCFLLVSRNDLDSWFGNPNALGFECFGPNQMADQERAKSLRTQIELAIPNPVDSTMWIQSTMAFWPTFHYCGCFLSVDKPKLANLSKTNNIHNYWNWILIYVLGRLIYAQSTFAKWALRFEAWKALGPRV